MTTLAKHGWLLVVALLPGCYFKDFELKDLTATGGTGGTGGEGGAAGGAAGDTSPTEITTAICGEQSLVNTGLEEVEIDGKNVKAIGWGTHTLPNYQVINDEREQDPESHTGNYFAWLGGYAGAYDLLWQTVVLPANFSGATLSFFWKDEVKNQLRTIDALDYLNVDLVDGDGLVFWRLASLTNLDAPVDPVTHKPAWAQVDLQFPDTDELAGRTYTIRFMGTTIYINGTQDEYYSNIYLDDITLTLNPCSVETDTGE
jgi:hypothetical protein